MAATLYTFTPSTQISMRMIGAVVSVTPATTCTGEDTVEFAAGVQMVTVWFTVLRVHPEEEDEDDTVTVAELVAVPPEPVAVAV